MENNFDNFIPDRIYLPAGGEYKSEENYDGVPAEQEIENYIKREFPRASEPCRTANYSIPGEFVPQGKAQAAQAERDTQRCLRDVTCPPAPRAAPLWQVCFQGACYAGRSYRNERAGKLMIREHDFVVFNEYQGKYYVSLIEVKSTCDDASSGFVVSNPTGIKNNKRSGLHQLRDHVEILEKSCGIPQDSLQCYLFWPFLTMWTKDPTGNKIQRWKEEENRHVFTDTISNTDLFNQWYHANVLGGKSMEKIHFDALFKRFIIMSCGIFVNEIHEGMLALLSQEQVELLYRKPTSIGAPTIVHGAAGTGKTLLVIHKLQHLHECGLLNDNNRALYICYWPGIRADFHRKLEKLKIDRYVDSIRFFISQEGFLHNVDRKYRHIFMDECEAICLAFAESIITKTFENIKRCRLVDPDESYERNQVNAGLYNASNGENGYVIENDEIVRKIPPRPEKVYGEMWFLVDINQAALFLPKYSPIILKNPQIVLSKVIRNTGTIFKVFSQFYKNPIPAASKLADLYLNNMDIGHKVSGPPIFWVNSDDLQVSREGRNRNSGTFHATVKVVIDLCSTKGIKPNDLCVLPFFVTSSFLPENINVAISSYYVTDGYRPMSTANVEEFLGDCDPNVFLVPWVLRVKGLEFKVVVMVIEQGDFEYLDPEDRRKIYIMASRCTCLLVVVSPESVKTAIDMYGLIQTYQFGIEL